MAMDPDPYAPPTATTSGRQFGLCALLLLATLATIAIGTWRAWGLAGIASAVAGIAVTQFMISRLGSAMLFPLNRHRMTVIELATALAISAILFGLSLPAVSSVPRRTAPSTSSALDQSGDE